MHYLNLKTILFFILVSCVLLFYSCNLSSDTEYPTFTNEEEITISGYSSDAMEPFISSNMSLLFFNSLNDSIDTSIFYSTRVDYKTFNYSDKLSGVNGNIPHLDAVSSIDKNNVFYFISTRNYPSSFINIFCGNYFNGAVSSITPVKGNIYVNKSGWIVMDAEISRDGSTLFYVNAHYANGKLDKSIINISVKNGTTGIFEKSSSSEKIMANVNNNLYYVYAPSITSDGNYLFFTRSNIFTGTTEICISVKKPNSLIFSSPKVIKVQGVLVEGVTVTEDNSRIYYHKKNKVSDKYKIYTMEMR